MTDRKEVLIIHETVKESWIKDASTFALFLALIGVGVVLDSEAMQWIGAMVGFMAIVHRASEFRKQHTFTIPEARSRLDDIEEGLS